MKAAVELPNEFIAVHSMLALVTAFIFNMAKPSSAHVGAVTIPDGSLDPKGLSEAGENICWLNEFETTPVVRKSLQ